MKKTHPFTALIALLIGLAIPATTAAQRTANPPDAYKLPIEGRGCGGFSYSDGSMYLFEYNGRQLYEVTRSGRLTPKEDVAGWYVVDVAVIDGAPIYCSRDRVFKKVRGKIQVNPIDNTEKLVSIAADDREIFLLDAAPKSTIIVLDKRTAKERRRLKYEGRDPADLACGDGDLWLLDRGDRCIHRLDKQTGATTLKFQAGPGVQGTNGLLYRDGALYVHEGDYSRLRRVEWKQEGNAVVSWSHDLRMTFIQDSSNVHDQNPTTVTFKIPLPPQRQTQQVGKFEWTQPPTRVFDDRFGQSIALFNDLRIAPKSDHTLAYRVDVQVQAVQYDPPNAPLASLEQIDPAIRRAYLASNELYKLDDPAIQAAAREARKGSGSAEPQNVRELIENIADYVIQRMTYQIDDTWNDAAIVLGRNTGSCSEYSFLFSSLCRLNQVPTRLVGGIQFGDYAAPHETKGFHRWTEVWFPELGWIPVDVTKIDGAEGSLDYEFLFGSPGYLIVVSQGDFDEQALGMGYYILRSYRGGKRERSNRVLIEPLTARREFRVVELTK